MIVNLYKLENENALFADFEKEIRHEYSNFSGEKN